MTQPFTLYSGHVCPYAQRVAIVAAEKGVALDRVMVDLVNKPDWFVALSPMGKIPVLKVGDDALFESLVIAEYLDETAAPKLHPTDPIARARHRGWMEYANAIHGFSMGLVVATDEAGFERARAEVVTRLARLEAIVEGPFFAGSAFSMVDAVYAPLLRGLANYEDIGGHPIFATLPRVAAWKDALLDRPSVIGSVAPDFKDRVRALVGMRETYLKSRLTQAA